MKAGLRVCAAVAATALVTGIAGAIPAGAETGAETKRDVCFEETRDDLSASYVYSLKVRNLSCDRGEKLVKKFHQCRHDNGGRNGHCNGVKGFSCKEKKLDSSPTLLQAKGKCVKGSQKFVNTFGELR